MGACKINVFRLHCLPDLQKILTLFTSQGQGRAATYLKCGGNHYMAFVANEEVYFLAVKEFSKSVKI